MKQLLGEYYTPVVWALWMTAVPMIVKGEFGFLPGLVSAVVAAGIAVLLTSKTGSQSERVKLMTLVGSVVLIVVFAALVVKPEKATLTSEVQMHTE